MSDHYELLGVDRDADAATIKKAYRRLARELHPDVTAGDAELEERFKAVSKAYEVLSDPDKRARYDRFGDEADVGGADFSHMSVNDIFSMFFGGGGGDAFGFGGGGGGRGPAGPPRGADLEVIADIDLHGAVFGCHHEVKVRTAERCEHCDGAGAEPPSRPQTCEQCGGVGQVRVVRQSLLGQMVTAGPCNRCSGMGQVISDPCTACRGEGRTIVERVLTIDVPAGVDEGTTLKLRGRGAVGQRGGPPGDLYVHVRVAPHELLRREGEHLTCDVHVPVTQAALGASLEIETLDGPSEFEVPRGTQTGRLVRLRGLGATRLGGRGRGDLVARIVVDVPTDLDEQTETLLRDLADHLGHEVADPPAGMLGRLRSALKGQ